MAYRVGGQRLEILVSLGRLRTYEEAASAENVVDDPKAADIGFADEVQPRSRFVSPHPALSLMSASTLPAPARFRRLGPPMFDSPRIAS
jgi:hypothetical protein